MNYSDTIRRLLQANPESTAEELVALANLDLAKVRKTLYDLHDRAEIRVLPKRYVLEKPLAEEDPDEKRLQKRKRATERQRASRERKRAAKALLPKQPRKPRELPEFRKDPAANEAMVQSAMKTQPLLATAWR